MPQHHVASAYAPIAPDLLFQGTMSRLQDDLIIEGRGGASTVVQGYFQDPQVLVSTAGAVLTPDVVRALAGGADAFVFAQAGQPALPGQIGRAERVEGAATVQRGGRTLPLAEGDPVFQGDVVATAQAAGSLGIKFVDGTSFTLSAGARMVLNELVYNPGATNNSFAASLVQGTFVFVAGQTARTGDMRIDTPVATMGIRGTTPLVVIDSLNGTVNFAIVPDPNGAVGRYELRDRITGDVLGVVSVTNTVLSLSSVGGSLTERPMTPSEQAAAAQLTADVHDLALTTNTLGPNQGSPPSSPFFQFPNQNGPFDNGGTDRRGDLGNPFTPADFAGDTTFGLIVNRLPVVTAISAGTFSQAGPPIEIDLVAGQSDPEGETLFARSVDATGADGRPVNAQLVGNEVIIDPGQFRNLAQGATLDVTVNYLVSDGKTNSPNTATFTIVGVNDAPEGMVFVPVGKLPENAAANTVVGRVAALDPDVGDQATYELLSDGNGRFAIDPATGIITVVAGAVLDFSDPTIVLTVKATDPYGEFVTANVPIELADVPEAPTSLTLSGVLPGDTLAENSVIGPGVKVADITFVDPDASDSGVSSEVLTIGGPDAASFQIVGRELFFVGAVPNFESQGTFAITVTVTDPNVPGSSLTQPFTLNVGDVNEAPVALTITGTLPANAAVEGTAVGTGLKVADLAFADPDGSGSGLVRGDYILAGPDAALFEVRGSELFFVGAGLDAETQAAYSVSVSVGDPTVPGSTPVTRTFGVTVIDVNEAPTALTIANTLPGGALAEQTVTAAGVKVADLIVTDPDTPGSGFTNAAFTLSGADAAAFEVRGTSLFYIGASPDFETKTTYEVTVTAADPALPGSTPVSQAFTLPVGDVNEAPTSFTIVETPGGLFLDNFVINGIWGPGSGIATGVTGAWSIASSPVDGSPAPQIERKGNGYTGTFSPTNTLFVDLEATAGNVQLTQSINGLTPGEVYNLSFEIGRADNIPSSSAQMVLLWNGVEIATYSPEPGLMQTVTVPLTAVDGTNTLTLREVGTGFDFSGTYVGNIQLDDVVVRYEGFDVGSGIKVADLVFTDPDGAASGFQQGVFTLSGPDAASFEVRDRALFYVGAAPDFETQSGYEVTVTLSDPTIPGSPSLSQSFALSVADVEEPSTFALFSVAAIEQAPTAVADDVQLTQAGGDVLLPASALAYNDALAGNVVSGVEVRDGASNLLTQSGGLISVSQSAAAGGLSAAVLDAFGSPSDSIALPLSFEGSSVLTANAAGSVMMGTSDTADQMTGGDGADVFVLNADTPGSLPGAIDMLENVSSGGVVDAIDLSLILPPDTVDESNFTDHVRLAAGDTAGTQVLQVNDGQAWNTVAQVGLAPAATDVAVIWEDHRVNVPVV